MVQSEDNQSVDIIESSMKRKIVKILSCSTKVKRYSIPPISTDASR